VTDVKSVLLITGGILLLGVIIFFLIRTIRKNQMTPAEHDEIMQADLKAEDAQYVKILEDIEKSENQKSDE